MNDENNANKSTKRQGLPLWALTAIVLLLLVGLGASTLDTPLESIQSEDIANVTLWSTLEKATSSKNVQLALGTIPDLSVSILDVGVLSKENKLVSSDSLSMNDTGALRIRVDNRSKVASENWSLGISLPTNDNFNYRSEQFSPLFKSESKTFVISYDKISKRGIHTLEVRIYTEDGDDTNNLDTKRIEVL